MVSKLIGMELPGTGTIFINEKLEYKKPVYVGDIITAIVEVVDIVESKRILEVYIKCVNQSEDIVLDGTSLLKII